MTLAGLSRCWSHIPHCWKSHVAAHVFVEMLSAKSWLMNSNHDAKVSFGIEPHKATEKELSKDASCILKFKMAAVDYIGKPIVYIPMLEI